MSHDELSRGNPAEESGRRRTSLAQRLGSWVAEDAGEEQRLKDLETFRESLARRWSIVAALALLLGAGKLLGWVAASIAALSVIVAGAAALNLGFIALYRRHWYRWWLVHALALADVVLVSLAIVFIGPGALVAGLYLAVLPYAFDRGRGVGEILVVVASAAYLGAAALHGSISGDTPGAFLTLPPRVYIEAAVFLGVAIMLMRIPATLVRRIRLTRAVMAQVEDGSLGARAPAERADELGFLEESLNRMLQEIATTISVVQREADEVATFAEVLARDVESVLASGRTVADAASELALAMTEQRRLADEGRAEGSAAAREATALRSKAELMETDTRRLVDAAERGRDRVGKASETLLSLGGEVRTTATTTQELLALSEGIGEFAETIAKIARRTRLLALNAAIEAARAEEHGEGFGAVAEQVRALATEAAASARDVTELVSEVRSGIETVAEAMAAGEKRVYGVGEVAEEARRALDEIRQGAHKAAELVEAATGSSQTQSDRLAALAQRLSRVAEISAHSASGAGTAAQQVSGQIDGLERINLSSKQLAQLAERLQESIARFSVLQPELVTHEHRTVDSSRA
jgi:methyl-accepting chemotaxis protein